nr:right-handed parallel beta-helix repeat-containing protein [Klebsiella pneumoniae]
MSENNYGALMMKSEISATDNIDKIFTPGIYRIPSNNDSSPDLNGGELTVFSGFPKRRAFVSNRVSCIISTCNSEDDKWSAWFRPLMRHEYGELTPEMFNTSLSSADDFSAPILAAISAAKNGPVKNILLSRMYKVSSTFDIPDGVTIRGGGSETGVYLETAPAEPMHIIFNMACVGSRLENFGVNFNTGGQGSISAVQVYGVFLQANSKDCTINGLTINGKPGDTVMGFSNGIRCTGAGNKILFCDIQYCSMGITHRGEDFLIDNNYCNNHFVDEFLQDWYPTSPFWDGITGEGSVRCTISNNTCECNGQSGIYLGGNGSYSHSNKYLNNTVRHNFNRGIDIGVS